MISRLCVDESRRRQISRSGYLIEATFARRPKTCSASVFDADAITLMVLMATTRIRGDSGKGGSKQGRSTELTYFWLNHKRPDLFSSLRDREEILLDAVIDANVFYDLLDPERNGAGESLRLTADWLADAISLCVTEELLTRSIGNLTAKSARQD